MSFADSRTVLLASAALALGASLLLLSKQRCTVHLDLPPGPPESSFILGNVSDIPPAPEEWKKYHEMSSRYGPVVHLRALNRHLVVLDTMKAAVDLLEKRGATYSGRPRLPMIGELMGYEWNITIMQYGNFWRMHRRALHQHLNETAVTRLSVKLERLNTKFLKALLETPEDVWNLTHWLAGANIMSAIYGLENTKFDHDPWIQLGEDTLKIANGELKAGFHLVDIFPFLKYVPSWLPGASFKRKAKEAHKLQLRSREEPFAWVKGQIAAGTAVPCITTALLDAEVDGAPLSEEVIKNCAGIAYIAGADTTLSTLKSFILAMVRNPDVLRKAQEELDSVIPAERLPSLADRDNSKLPYLEAVLRETYRKYPPIPLALPHLSMQEDTYEGMRIPAGGILIPNIWSMMQDEKTFTDPHLFQPERFLRDGQLDKNVTDPRSAVFGFGRRICPGRHFADSEIWLMMAAVLYCFDILPAQDDNGRDIVPLETVTEGAVVAPVEFPCRILPRSSSKRALIIHASEQAW